ncbi:MAG: ester cyclase [Cyanobacteria bacterium J06632_22]
MSSGHERELVLQFYQYFDQRRVEQALAMLAPEFVAHMAGLPAPLDKTGFTDFGLAFYNAFTHGQHRFVEIVVQADRVVTCGTFSARHTGTFQGLPATGRDIEIAVMHIDRVKDGTIVEHWGQGDAQGLMQQLGILFFPGPGLLVDAIKQQMGGGSR